MLSVIFLSPSPLLVNVPLPGYHRVSGSPDVGHGVALLETVYTIWKFFQVSGNGLAESEVRFSFDPAPTYPLGVAIERPSPYPRVTACSLSLYLIQVDILDSLVINAYVSQCLFLAGVVECLHKNRQ